MFLPSTDKGIYRKTIMYIIVRVCNYIVDIMDTSIHMENAVDITVKYLHTNMHTMFNVHNFCQQKEDFKVL